MSNRSIVIICLLAAFFGAGYYLYLNDIVLVWHPQRALLVRQSSSAQTRPTKVQYLKNGEWRTDTVDVLWDDKQPRIAHLIQQLLHTMHDEGVIARKVALEFAQTNASGSTLFVQFDRSPLHRHKSVADNVAIIDSMLKTVHLYSTGISAVAFLIHHAPLQDAHLTFNQPWPIQSYLLRS